MIKTYKNDGLTLREKCLNTEFFLVQIRENTNQKKLRIWTLFTQFKPSRILASKHETNHDSGGLCGGCVHETLKARKQPQQMFFKIGVLKYFAIFSGKYLCWSQPYSKETPTKVFFCEYC